MFDHIDSDETAFQFALAVRAYIGPDNWCEMQRRNTHDSAYAGDVCASHDFCDANVFLHEAIMARAAGYRRRYLAPNQTDESEQELRDALAPVWNEIHAKAKAAYFSEHVAPRVTVEPMSSVADHRDILATCFAVRGADSTFSRQEMSESLACSIGDDAPPEVWTRCVEIIGRFFLNDLDALRPSLPEDCDIDDSECPLILLHGFRAVIADSVIGGAA